MDGFGPSVVAPELKAPKLDGPELEYAPNPEAGLITLDPLSLLCIAL